LGDTVIVCPICGADQSSAKDVNLDNVSKQLTSSASILIHGQAEYDINERKLEIERLIQRGDDCFKSAKAWQGAKDKSRARKDYQRAFKYYDSVLKMDPENNKIRDLRAKCLFKMA
jgi:tetratricopeptide (TPR) repeat protein